MSGSLGCLTAVAVVLVSAERLHATSALPGLAPVEAPSTPVKAEGPVGEGDAAGRAAKPESPAAGVLTTEKLYVGLKRPLVVTVNARQARQTLGAGGINAPESLAGGGVAIALLEPATAREFARVDVAADLNSAATRGDGTVRLDLGKAAPAIWNEGKPLYAQLVAGDRRIGPPLVLQPLIQPRRAVMDMRNPARPMVTFPEKIGAGPRAFSGYRVYTDKVVVMETELGELAFALRPDAAPNTAWNFRHLVEGGFFDGTDFFRTVPVGSMTGKGFVVQGGDPTLAEPYEGGPGYDLDLEPSTLAHDYGVLSMARDTEPDTAGSQFFICLSREETKRLDGQYAAFGQLLAAAPTGAAANPVEVLGKIAASKLVAGKVDRPVKPVKILKMRLVDALPFGTGPRVLTLEGNKAGVR